MWGRIACLECIESSAIGQAAESPSLQTSAVTHWKHITCTDMCVLCASYVLVSHENLCLRNWGLDLRNETSGLCYWAPWARRDRAPLASLRLPHASLDRAGLNGLQRDRRPPQRGGKPSPPDLRGQREYTLPTEVLTPPSAVETVPRRQRRWREGGREQASRTLAGSCQLVTHLPSIRRRSVGRSQAHGRP